MVWQGFTANRATSIRRAFHAEVRRGVPEPSESVGVIEDGPTDNMILDSAVAPDAEFIVTGDEKRLLLLSFFRGVSIVGSEGFLALFSAV